MAMNSVYIDLRNQYQQVQSISLVEGHKKMETDKILLPIAAPSLLVDLRWITTSQAKEVAKTTAKEVAETIRSFIKSIR